MKVKRSFGKDVKVATMCLKNIYISRGWVKPPCVSIFLFVEGGEDTEFDLTDAFQQE